MESLIKDNSYNIAQHPVDRSQIDSTHLAQQTYEFPSALSVVQLPLDSTGVGAHNHVEASDVSDQNVYSSDGFWCMQDGGEMNKTFSSDHLESHDKNEVAEDASKYEKSQQRALCSFPQISGSSCVTELLQSEPQGQVEEHEVSVTGEKGEDGSCELWSTNYTAYADTDEFLSNAPLTVLPGNEFTSKIDQKATEESLPNLTPVSHELQQADLKPHLDTVKDFTMSTNFDSTNVRKAKRENYVFSSESVNENYSSDNNHSDDEYSGIKHASDRLEALSSSVQRKLHVGAISSGLTSPSSVDSASTMDSLAWRVSRKVGENIYEQLPDRENSLYYPSREKEGISNSDRSPTLSNTGNDVGSFSAGNRSEFIHSGGVSKISTMNLLPKKLPSRIPRPFSHNSKKSSFYTEVTPEMMFHNRISTSEPDLYKGEKYSVRRGSFPITLIPSTFHNGGGDAPLNMCQANKFFENNANYTERNANSLLLSCPSGDKQLVLQPVFENKHVTDNVVNVIEPTSNVSSCDTDTQYSDAYSADDEENQLVLQTKFSGENQHLKISHRSQSKSEKRIQSSDSTSETSSGKSTPVALPEFNNVPVNENLLQNYLTPLSQDASSLNAGTQAFDNMEPSFFLSTVMEISEIDDTGLSQYLKPSPMQRSDVDGDDYKTDASGNLDKSIDTYLLSSHKTVVLTQNTGELSFHSIPAVINESKSSIVEVPPSSSVEKKMFDRFNEEKDIKTSEDKAIQFNDTEMLERVDDCKVNGEKVHRRDDLSDDMSFNWPSSNSQDRLTMEKPDTIDAAHQENESSIKVSDPGFLVSKNEEIAEFVQKIKEYADKAYVEFMSDSSLYKVNDTETLPTATTQLDVRIAEQEKDKKLLNSNSKSSNKISGNETSNIPAVQAEQGSTLVMMNIDATSQAVKSAYEEQKTANSLHAPIILAKLAPETAITEVRPSSTLEERVQDLLQRTEYVNKNILVVSDGGSSSARSSPEPPLQGISQNKSNFGSLPSSSGYSNSKDTLDKKNNKCTQELTTVPCQDISAHQNIDEFHKQQFDTISGVNTSRTALAVTDVTETISDSRKFGENKTRVCELENKKAFSEATKDNSFIAGAFFVEDDDIGNDNSYNLRSSDASEKEDESLIRQSKSCRSASPNFTDNIVLPEPENALSLAFDDTFKTAELHMVDKEQKMHVTFQELRDNSTHNRKDFSRFETRLKSEFDMRDSSSGGKIHSGLKPVFLLGSSVKNDGYPTASTESLPLQTKKLTYAHIKNVVKRDENAVPCTCLPSVSVIKRLSYQLSSDSSLDDENTAPDDELVISDIKTSNQESASKSFQTANSRSIHRRQFSDSQLAPTSDNGNRLQHDFSTDTVEESTQEARIGIGAMLQRAADNAIAELLYTGDCAKQHSSISSLTQFESKDSSEVSLSRAKYNSSNDKDTILEKENGGTKFRVKRAWMPRSAFPWSSLDSDEETEDTQEKRSSINETRVKVGQYSSTESHPARVLSVGSTYSHSSTEESSHSGSTDAAPPDFPPHVIGSRSAPAAAFPGIYARRAKTEIKVENKQKQITDITPVSPNENSSVEKTEATALSMTHRFSRKVLDKEESGFLSDHHVSASPQIATTENTCTNDELANETKQAKDPSHSTSVLISPEQNNTKQTNEQFSSSEAIFALHSSTISTANDVQHHQAEESKSAPLVQTDSTTESVQNNTWKNDFGLNFFQYSTGEGKRSTNLVTNDNVSMAEKMASNHRQVSGCSDDSDSTIKSSERGEAPASIPTWVIQQVKGNSEKELEIVRDLWNNAVKDTGAHSRSNSDMMVAVAICDKSVQANAKSVGDVKEKRMLLGQEGSVSSNNASQERKAKNDLKNGHVFNAAASSCKKRGDFVKSGTFTLEDANKLKVISPETLIKSWNERLSSVLDHLLSSSLPNNFKELVRKLVVETLASRDKNVNHSYVDRGVSPVISCLSEKPEEDHSRTGMSSSFKSDSSKPLFGHNEEMPTSLKEHSFSGIIELHGIVNKDLQDLQANLIKAAAELRRALIAGNCQSPDDKSMLFELSDDGKCIKFRPHYLSELLDSYDMRSGRDSRKSTELQQEGSHFSNSSDVESDELLQEVLNASDKQSLELIKKSRILRGLSAKAVTLYDKKPVHRNHATQNSGAATKHKKELKNSLESANLQNLPENSPHSSSANGSERSGAVSVSCSDTSVSICLSSRCSISSTTSSSTITNENMFHKYKEELRILRKILMIRKQIRKSQGRSSSELSDSSLLQDLLFVKQQKELKQQQLHNEKQYRKSPERKKLMEMYGNTPPQKDKHTYKSTKVGQKSVAQSRYHDIRLGSNLKDFHDPLLKKLIRSDKSVQVNKLSRKRIAKDVTLSDSNTVSSSSKSTRSLDAKLKYKAGTSADSSASKENMQPHPGLSWFIPAKKEGSASKRLKDRSTTGKKATFGKQKPTKDGQQIWGGATDGLSLQEALLLAKPTFITHCRERQRYVRLNAAARKLHAQQLQILNMDETHKPDTIDVLKAADLFSKKRVITEEEMKARTQRMYSKLPEVQLKRIEENRLRQQEVNRLRAQTYKKVLTDKVLQGKVNWSLNSICAQ